MLYWIIINVNHIVVPMGISLGLFSIALSLSSKKTLREGKSPKHSKLILAALCSYVAVACIVLGIAIARIYA